MEKVLYQQSGLLGISGISNDMRALTGNPDPAARLAVEYFVYQAVKHVGALSAVLGGVDALVFTAGIGEHSSEIRRRICERLEWLGVTLDRTANAAHGPRITTAGSSVGDPDQRGADDRPAHGATARNRRTRVARAPC